MAVTNVRDSVTGLDVALEVVTDAGGNELPAVGLYYLNAGGVLTPVVSTAGVIAVSVSSLPLPTGAATGAKQDTGNTSLASVDTKLTSQATAARQDTGNTSLGSIDTKTPALGQAAASASSPVVIASDQSVITTLQQSKVGVAGDVAAPAANTAAVNTYAAAGAGVANVLGMVVWSYNAAPTAGRLTIVDNATTLLDIDITAAGPGFIEFMRPMKGQANQALVITLAAGGSGVTGKLSCRHWTE